MTEQAQELFDAIFEPDDVIEIRTLTSNGASGQKWSDVGIIDQEADIFFGVNPRKGSAWSGRNGTANESDVAKYRTAFADFDHTTVASVTERLEILGVADPTAIISSGHGVHVYWRLAVDIAEGPWRKLQAVIARALASDSKVVDPARIMRLPGSRHVMKGGGAKCEVVFADGDPVTFSDLVDSLPGSDEPDFEDVEPGAGEIAEPGPDFSDLPINRSDAIRAAKEVCLTSAPAIQGNDGQTALLSVFRKIVWGLGLEPGEAVQIVRDVYNPRCSPPWDMSNRKEWYDLVRKSRQAESLPKSMKYTKRGWMLDEVQPQMPKPPVKKKQASEVIEPAPVSIIKGATMFTVVRGDQTNPCSPPWFMHNRFPVGINMMLGMPDVGKSTVMAELASAVTNEGWNWPREIDIEHDEDRAIPTGSVLWLAGESSIDNEIAPRLVAANANMKKVHIISGIRRPAPLGGFEDQSVAIDQDVAELRRYSDSLGDVKLVVVDPLDSFIGDVNIHSGPEVRRMMKPFSDWAMDSGITIMIVHHPNKSRGEGSAIDSVSGARSFGAMPRSVWLIGKDSEGERFLAPVKTNLSAGQPNAIHYEIVSVKGTNGDTFPAVKWIGETDEVSANTLLSADRGKGDGQHGLSKSADVLRILDKYMPVGTRLTTDEMLAHARTAGIADLTFKRHAKEHGCRAERVGLDWTWTRE